MSENVSIKIEPFANDCKQEDSNSDITTLSYNTNILNDIKEDIADLDKMEEFLPENVNEFPIDIIKKEDVNEMDEFLPEDSTSHYSPASLTWKSDDRAEVITHDEVHQQHATQQHLTGATAQQISLPKLEIIDVHTDENYSKNIEMNGDTHANVSDNKERPVISSSRVAKTPTEHKCEHKEKNHLLRHMINKHRSSEDAVYICEICTRRFATKQGLETHSTRVHRGTDSTEIRSKYNCKLCDSSFTEKRSLRRHMRRNHPLSIDTKYMCQICNERFVTPHGLDLHSQRVHSTS
ncbi:uncharacterized protein [Musca autumnalis]|uniref:uncharacterized protein n=1 Tax=Musca autumnalis TaxID=221902 RepID=UPI003CEF7BE2